MGLKEGATLRCPSKLRSLSPRLGLRLLLLCLASRERILSTDLTMRRRNRLIGVCDPISTSLCLCYSTLTSIGFAFSLIDLLSGTETIRIPCFNDTEISVSSLMSAGKGRLRWKRPYRRPIRK